MDRELKDLTFDELVNYCAEQVLKELMTGKFRTGVFECCRIAAQWSTDRQVSNQPASQQ